MPIHRTESKSAGVDHPPVTEPMLPGHRVTLLRFLVVGGVGTLTNLLVFFVLVDLRKWHPTLGAILGFAVASAQNYFLNHYWTFARQVRGAPASAGGYLRFMTVSLAALGVNLLLLWTILWTFDPPWKSIAQAVGIAAATVVNYTGSRFWAFRAK